LRKIRAYAIAAVVGVALISHAAVVMEWDFTGYNGNEATIAATTIGPYMQSGTLSRGPGLTAVAGADTYSAGGWSGDFDLQTSEYFQFTMVPNSGYMYSVTQLTYKLEIDETNNGPAQWALRSDDDGYTSDLHSWSDYGTGVFTQSVDLGSNPDFQDVTDTTTFRLYGWDMCGIGTPIARLRSDSPGIFIEGSTEAIPEPSTILCIFLGAAVFGVVRGIRKRR